MSCRACGGAKDIYSVNVSDIAALMDMQTGRIIHSVYGIYAIREYDDIVLRKRQDKSCIQEKDGSNADNVGGGKELYDKNVCEYDVEVDISALSSSITVNIGKTYTSPERAENMPKVSHFCLLIKKHYQQIKKYSG